MTNINELTAKLKAAALKLNGEQWQARKGFSGIEVIVKGSLSKGRGCESYQPVDADVVDNQTAKAIALFSPANVLALIEALEAAEKRIAQLESAHKFRKAWKQLAIKSISEREKDIAELTEARQRIAELEARTLTVKLPEYRNSPDMHTKQFYEAIGFNQGLDACAEAMCTAGIKLQIEGE